MVKRTFHTTHPTKAWVAIYLLQNMGHTGKLPLG